MKSMLVVLMTAFSLSSCVFEEPFESKAMIPVDPALVGVWVEVTEDANPAPSRMLVLQHSENEYLVQYPVGDKAMFFRAYAIDLMDGRYIQIQLIGTADGAVKPEDRKHHLLKTALNQGELEIRTIKPDSLGKAPRDTESLRAAFAARRYHAELFGDAVMFRRR